MSVSWEQASKCPRDGAYTGNVIARRRVGSQGQLVTLECPETNCPYSASGMGWLVQIFPDGTIPEPIDVRTRPKQFQTSMTDTQKQRVRDALAQQVEAEQKPGHEVRNY